MIASAAGEPDRGPGVAPWLVRVVLVGIVAVCALGLAFIAKGFYVDWLWYVSVGYQRVYTTILGAKVALFAAGAGLAVLMVAPNVLVARRLAGRRWAAWERRASEDVASGGAAGPRAGAAGSGAAGSGAAEPDAGGPGAIDGGRDAAPVVLAVAVVASLLLGWWASSKWDVVLRLPHASSFGQADPLFGRDVSFFVFTLPVLAALRTWALWVAGLALAGAAGVYFARLVLPQSGGSGFRFDDDSGEWRVELGLGAPIRTHLSLLGAATFALLAWHQRLKMFDLVFSARGTTFGAGYADIHATWPALWALLVVAAVAAVALVAGTVVRGPWIGIGAVAVFVPVWLVGAVAAPWIVQRLQVAPNELQLESPYIARNIAMTRLAYGLDQVEESPFPVAEAVTRQEVERSPGTLLNVRLWDYEPLLATYNQIQSIRAYYDFLDADFDRYVVDGDYRQVMISGRELSPQRLPADAQTWVNRRLQFTHGYGVVVSPVNEVTAEGLPTLFVQDVPPRGKLTLTRPEIYYGESQAGWVVVRSAVPEFDYPRGNDNVQATYAGTSGAGIGSFFRRVLFAWQMRDFNLLATPALRADSRILFNRNIHERVRKVAPFLVFDTDPYLVVADGRLVWLYDAYTATRQYPYAQPVVQQLNYLRNSVKVAIDAYDGSMTFYVADASDPLIRAYAGALPGMFKPLDEMPATLRAHIRYPGVLFSVQAQMYRLYHVQDTRVFYQREDLLTIPTELYLGAQRPVPVRPYYAIMRLPGEPREEFVYILPYTPPGKDNMITWLAARSDGAHYGKLVAYQYPKDTLIFGPLQIEARIDQDPTISSQFTLWNQGGSRVLRGNMLAIPIGQSNLYVEPIYLQAERSRLPEMKRVVVATGNRVAMGISVEDALAQLYGGPIAFQAPDGADGAAGGPVASGPATAPAAVGPAPPPVAAAPTQAGAAPAAAAAAPGGSEGATGVDRQALVGAVRALQQRAERLQQENDGIQQDLQRLLDALQDGAK